MTLISRAAGFVRDAMLAGLLGTGTAGDAWTAAFQLPNTLRRLVGEGNVSAAFLPVFAAESRERQGHHLWALAERLHSAIALFAGALTAAGVLAAPLIVPWLYPGYASVAGKTALTVRLTQLAFPYLICIASAAVLMAVLNARGRFAAAAFTPVLLNLSMIAGAAVGWLADLRQPVYAIVVGAVAGGALQWAFLVPFVRRAGMRVRPRADLDDPALRRIVRLMVPGLFGVSIVQINILVGRLLASELQEGSVTSLYYASRINELTLGVFVISVATVVLPTMSQHGAAGRMGALRDTLALSLRHVMAMTIPATVGIVLLRTDIARVLFERGRFDGTSTALTAAALWGYSLGLVGIAVVRVTAPAFYALRDTRTPVVAAALAMVVNIAGCLWLRESLANAGIALANSLATFVNAGVLLLLLRGRLNGLAGKEVLAAAIRIGLAAGAMAWVVAGVRPRAMPVAAHGGWSDAAGLAATVALGLLTYAAALAVLRAPELMELRGGLRRKLPDTLAATGDDEDDS